MAEFTAYSSNRIGGEGPYSGMQYNVDAWFPDSASSSIDEDIFADPNRARLIVGIKIIAAFSTSGNKTFLWRAKPRGVVPAIFNPGIDVCRKLIEDGLGPTSNELKVWTGKGEMTKISSTSAQWWFPMRLFLDKEMDLNINFQVFTSQSAQIHYLTGSPQQLMQATHNAPTF